MTRNVSVITENVAVKYTFNLFLRDTKNSFSE